MAKQRKHGSGTVRLRSDGRWEGRVVIGYDDSGLPKTKNVLAKTKTECEKKLKSLIAAQKGSEPQPPRQTMTVAQWLDFWYQTYKKPNLRPNTQMSYERRIYQHIIPNLGPTPLNKLTTGDIQQFYTGLKQNGRLLRQEQYGEGLSDQTVRGIHTTFHAALDKAVSEKIIPKNLSDFCRLPSAKAREMQVLSPEEIQRLLIQAKEDGCFELLLLELSTGLRRGEICALQWDDLNFNTGELQVKRQVHRVKGELAVSEPKTKASNRSVILPPPVLMVLSDYKTEINSVWLFPSPLNNNSPRDPAAVRKRLTTILERADCKRVRFHDLRHTFATASLEHGMDIKTLSAIIGHVSTATTLNVYAHVTDEMRKIAAAKIDRGIAKSESLQDIDTAPRKPAPSTFLPHKGQRRKPGIDFQNNVVQVSKAVTLVDGKQVCKTPKTKSSYRSVSFSRFLAARFKALQLAELQQRFQFGQDWQGDDWVFIQENGKMMSYSTPYESFQDAIRRYNDGRVPEQQLPLIPFHGLRHTSATLLIASR